MTQTWKPNGQNWHDEKHMDGEPGYGIYAEGTDRLRIVNNLIGKCRNSGYYAKTTAFHVSHRGGTARDNKFYGNLFYDCKTAAMIFPNEHNESDWNAFVKMRRGGYLRIVYPLSTVCLDLAHWQEFFGFDKNGYLGDLEIAVDDKAMTMTVVVDKALPEIEPYAKIRTDYFLEAIGSAARNAGLFGTLPAGKTVISIDPRKTRRLQTTKN